MWNKSEDFWDMNIRDVLSRKEVQAGTGTVKPKGSHIQSENPVSGWFL